MLNCLKTALKRSSIFFFLLLYPSLLFSEGPSLKLVKSATINSKYYVKLYDIDKEQLIKDLRAGHSTTILFQIDFIINQEQSVKELFQKNKAGISIERLGKWDYFTKKFVCEYSDGHNRFFKDKEDFLENFFRLDYEALHPELSYLESRLRVVFWPKRLLAPLFILDLLGFVSPVKTAWLDLPRKEL